MGPAADRAAAAEGRGPDAGREAGIGAAAGEFARHLLAEGLTWVLRGSVWSFKKARSRAPAERRAFTASCLLHSKVHGRNAKRPLGFWRAHVPERAVTFRDVGFGNKRKFLLGQSITGFDPEAALKTPDA